MQLVLAAIIYPQMGEAAQEVALLKLANAWLQRQKEGLKDSLLLIGLNFPTVDEVRRLIGPFGLTDVDVEVLTLDEDEGSVRNEGNVDAILEQWLSRKHPGSVSFLNWRTLPGATVFPDIDWWWTGVEAGEYAEMSSIYDGILEALPRAFRPTIATWLELLLHQNSRWIFDSEAASHEVCMDALGLARWLEGYDAVSENGFYEFDYAGAAKRVPIDQMRLGQEAWRDFPDEISEAFDDAESSEDDLCVACLRECLKQRNDSIAKSLRDAFGGATPLLWALHSTIWPKLNRPMAEAANELVSGDFIPLEELEPQWRFVTEGWGEFDED